MASNGEATPGKSLSLRSVSKSFADVPAIHEVTLDIAAGEFMTLLGPSGSGKTTTLNVVAGFVQPTAGQIFLGDRDISMTPCHRRGIGMVFQSYALFPHMTVAQNVAYPLKQRKVSSDDRTARVREALDLVELLGLEDRRPSQLSGGQQQRVALARALVFRPPVLLMDEPLGALDKRLRETLQLEMKRLHRELGITFVYVTHDQEEALVLSDRVAVFRNGRIEQVGTAEELYERPRTTFVAEFLGDSNLFAGVADPSRRRLRMSDGLEINSPECGALRPGQSASVVLRPERAKLTTAGDRTQPYDNTLMGTVDTLHYLGSACKVEIETSAGRMVVREPADARTEVRPGDRVEVCWQAADGMLIADDPPASEAGSDPLASVERTV